MLRKLHRGLLCLLLLPLACTPYEPGPVSITLDESMSGRIFFTSTDAYDFPDMITKSAMPRIIEGDLTLPPNGTALRGGVVLSHGSAGPGSRQDAAVELLSARGYAVFNLDHFGPRDVRSTVEDQLRITEQGMLADVTAAQRFLATHPGLEASKIGHIGWSKGGAVSVLGAVERFAGYAGAEAPLAFAIAFYPFCGLEISKETLNAPLLIQVGAEDDWTPAAPCRTLVDTLTAAGQDAAIDVYPGALHGFDSRAPDMPISSAIAIRRVDPMCTLSVDADGQTVSVDGAHNLATLEARKAWLDACGEDGVVFGGNPAARAASRERMVRFVEQHLP